MVSSTTPFESGIYTLFVTADQTPGNLRLENEFEVDLGPDVPFDPTSVSRPATYDTYTIKYRPAFAMADLNVTDDVASRIASEVTDNPVQKEIVLNYINNNSPDFSRIYDALSDAGLTAEFEMDFPNNPLAGGTVRESNTIEVSNIPTITLPVPQNAPIDSGDVRGFINDALTDANQPGFISVPSESPSRPVLGFEVWGGPADNTGTRVMSGDIIIEDELVYETRTVDLLGELRCIDMDSFSSIQDRITTRVQRDMPNVSRLQDMEADLNSIESDLGIQNQFDVSVPGADLPDGTNDFSAGDQVGDNIVEPFEDSSGVSFLDGSINVSTPDASDVAQQLSNRGVSTAREDIQNALERATDIQDNLGNVDDPSNLLNQFSNIRDDAGRRLPERCIEELGLDALEDELMSASDLYTLVEQHARELISFLEDLLEELGELDVGGAVDCLEVPGYSDLKSEIQALGRLVGKVPDVRDGNVNIRDARPQLPDGFSPNATGVRNIESMDITNIDSTTISNLTPGNLRTKVDSLRSEIRTRVPSESSVGAGITGPLGPAGPGTPDNTIRDCFAQLLQMLNAIEEGIDEVAQGTNIGDCAAEFTTIDRQLSQLESEVDLGRQADTSSVGLPISGSERITEITDTRGSYLRDSLEDVKNSITTQINRQNRCRSELMQRANRIEDRLDQLSSGPGELDCSQRYSDITSAFNDLQTITPDGSGPITQSRQAEITSGLSDITTLIESEVQEQQCIEEFTNSVNAIRSDLFNVRVRQPPSSEVSIDCKGRFDGLIETGEEIYEDAQNLRRNQIQQLRRKLREPEGFLPNLTVEELIQIAQDEKADIEQRQSEWSSEISSRVNTSAFDGDSPAASTCQNGLFDLNGNITRELNGYENSFSQILERADSIGGSDPTCEDVSQDLKTAVGDYEEQSNQFLDKSVDERTEERKNTLLSNGEDLRSRINSEVDSANPCKSDLRTRVSNKLNNVRDARTEPRITCDNVPARIKNNVSSFESGVQSFLSRPVSRRTRERRDSLVEEASETLDNINAEIDDDDPCKGRFRNRVNTPLTQLQNAELRSRASIPCAELYPDANERLEAFDQRVLNLTAPVTPEQVQLIAESGQEVTDVIRNNVPSDDPCRQRMINRTRNLVNRAQSLTTQVRIEEAQEGDSDRQELLQNVLTNLNELNTRV